MYTNTERGKEFFFHRDEVTKKIKNYVNRKHYHHHFEISLHGRLGDVQNVDIVLRQKGTDCGNNTDLVLTNNGNDGVHIVPPDDMFFEKFAHYSTRS